MKKYVIWILVLLAGAAVGNRIFNHLNPWIGILVIAISSGFAVYKIKNMKEK